MKTDNIVSARALPLMEQFYTIQGEGAFQGTPAYFVRIAGCDVGCVWCDVKDSWNAEDHPIVAVDEMVSLARQSGGQIVVVTGGEPAMYDLAYLTEQIHREGLRTHIETSGAYPLSGEWDWVCLSPKKFKQPVEDIFPQADELKIVVYNQTDFKWAEDHAREVSATCKLYLQPEWSVEKKVLPKIIEYAKANPKWRISLQVHKYMDIP
ncbi:MAG: 7-carboxy-7-deazaguanine synthase QueE [Cyclobacteriaceae bacterium]